ncbi:hypothetical protein FA95DRAFT_1529759 [Auriscalpium vulgare]|uniref:Uncharacterized protein n=1 Tax=Auriscalpium vulgare TaxID=40419 RepID=A0ACB8SCA9_9AGAM|nr:hypothetical protein FA95DRAFT_1529759 [Auriscalpium vulgare]
MPARSYVFYALNAIRAFSVIGLLLVFSSSIVVLVHDVQAVNRSLSGNSNSTDSCDYIADSTVPDQPAGVFWAVVNRLFIIFQVIFLILAEVEWPITFFDRFFPVLGSEFGLGALGVFQCLIGATILSHHVDDFTLVAAFFLFSIGCVNIVAGLIFREKAKPKRSIRAWRDDKNNALPTSRATSNMPSFRSSLFGGRKADASEFGVSDKASFGFGRQGEKQAGLKGFLISQPVESLPRYATPRPISGMTDVVSPVHTSPPSFRSSPTAI